MPPRTRRSRNVQPSPTSTAVTSALHSTATSVTSGTPATSDAGLDSGRRSNASSRSKSAYGDLEDDDDEELPKPALKRKRSQVYVELPRRVSLRSVKTLASVASEGPGVKARTNVTISDEEDEVPSAKGKGKGKAPAPSANAKGKRRAPPPAATDDDVEVLSDASLEYDENASVEESDGSGSEYQKSDDDENEIMLSDASDAIDDDIQRKPRKSPRKARGRMSEDLDDDDVMVGAAIQMSLEDGDEGADEAIANIRKLTADAAARRLSRGDEDDADADADVLSSLSEIDVSEEEPLSKKAEGKAKRKAAPKKGKGKGKSKAVDSDMDLEDDKFMTLAKLRKKNAAERKAKKSKRAILRAEENELRRELGRALTQSEKNTIALYKEHPELKNTWGDLETRVKPVKPEKAEQPETLKVTLLPFQQESLFWMHKQEQSPWKGGMLADEMGMGKTIQMIALLISDKLKPNLVVAPTVAIMQWRNEIEAHTHGLKVLVWYGANRESSNAAELEKYDVVLTTYAVLESSFRKQHSGFKRKGQIIKEKSLPHQMKWRRIILDEAHNIKERSTNTAKATFELQAEYKWCLSGTPLQNRVGELYSLIRFIGIDPFAYYYCKRCDCKSLHWKFTNKKNCDKCGCTPMQHTCFWNNEILSPIQKHGMEGPGKYAFKKLRVLLDRMMLRRTKIERADDLGLPPRTVTVRRDYFSPEEKELYLSLFSDAKRTFSTYLDSGTILNNYSNVFSLITRMRQMACHPDLVLRSKNNHGKFAAAGEDEEATLCRLCNDIAEDAIQAKCRHIFDRECIKQYLNTAVEQVPACPVCHLPLTIDLEAPALELQENTTARQGILGRINLDTWRSSTKIEALVEELTNLRNQDATTKSIVFSQFVNFLDLIAYRLQRAGFVICRLEGNMSPQARDLTIKHFMNNVHVTVFLVSLKAGGVALNLTEANRVYLMDSWWNPAVEFQAMDRIHRLGQHRPVQAIKLVVEDSIESRIIQLQEKKSAMVDATLSTDDSAMGRLTPEDLGFLFRL